jgi:hypothetical protein
MMSRLHAAARGAGADFGLAHRVVGIGERVDPVPRTLAEAVYALSARYGEKTGRMLARFAGVPEGAFVWTQASDGLYRLGRIAGPWRYDDSPAARAVGIHHVRPALWAAPALTAADVPAAVRETFARGGRNFQRTHDRAAEVQTAQLWNRGRTGAKVPPAPRAGGRATVC